MNKKSSRGKIWHKDVNKTCPNLFGTRTWRCYVPEAALAGRLSGFWFTHVCVCVCGPGRANSVSPHDVSRHADKGLTESDFDESDSLCLTIKARERRERETEVHVATIIEPHL